MMPQSRAELIDPLPARLARRPDAEQATFMLKPQDSFWRRQDHG
jgi:hypothetical protein